jgi:hypothetical protein
MVAETDDPPPQDARRSMAGPGRTISERLSAAAEREFVGRRPELDRLAEAMGARPPPFLVAFIHGPGGMGKSRLLRRALASAQDAGAGTLVLNCR